MVLYIAVAARRTPPRRGCWPESPRSAQTPVAQEARWRRSLRPSRRLLMPKGCLRKQMRSRRQRIPAGRLRCCLTERPSELPACTCSKRRWLAELPDSQTVWLGPACCYAAGYRPASCRLPAIHHLCCRRLLPVCRLSSHTSSFVVHWSLRRTAEAQWRLARCYSDQGDANPAASEKQALFEQGLAAAEKAVALEYVHTATACARSFNLLAP